MINAISTFGVAITAYLIFQQLRFSKKPQISIEIKPIEKEDDKQSSFEYVKKDENILGSGDLFMYITNVSSNTAENICVEYSINYQRPLKKEDNNSFFIPYLHQNESAREHFPLDKIVESNKSLFVDRVKNNSRKTIPKETIRFVFQIKITYNPIICCLFKYQTQDEFEIEWGSLDNYPREKDHPVIHSWNKRAGITIIKK